MRLRNALDGRLAAVWLAGSAATADYEPGRSDVDVVAAAHGSLGAEVRDRIVGAVRHEALPCPARKLELAVHRTAALERGLPGVELNLETGAGGTTTAEAEPFWFVIDLAVLRARGVALEGPPPALLMAEPARRRILDALIASLAWHMRPDAPLDDAVLNACRALRWVSDGRWVGKREAGGWAVAEGAAPRDVVEAALAVRGGKPAARTDAGAVAAFLDSAYRLVAARIASSSSGRRNS